MRLAAASAAQQTCLAHETSSVKVVRTVSETQDRAP